MEWIYEILDYVLFANSSGTYKLTISSILSSIVILLTAWFLSRQLRKLLNRPGFLKSIPQDDPRRQSLIRTSRLMIWPVGMILAVINLGVNLNELLDQPLPLPWSKDVKLYNVAIIAGIIFLTRFVLGNAHRLFVKLGESRRIPMDQGRRMAIYQIFKYLIYILITILILVNIDARLSGLLVSSAAIFVGVGLALQQTFSDIASGITILFDGTVEIGDVVYIDSLNLEGAVVEIKLRTSIIETLDSVSVIVPNSKLTSTNVVNWKFNDKETRFRVNIGVAYGSNVQLVRKVLTSCAASHGLILKNPPPRVRFVNFGESSLDFELLFWTHKLQEHADIKSDLRFMIDAEFRRKEIEIPFPQRDIHIRSDIRAILNKQVFDENKEAQKEIKEKGDDNS